MIPGDFDYVRPSSLDEAIDALADNPGARVLAGGHSLIPMMKLRLAAPPLLVDIGGLDELSGIRRDGDDLVVGAMTTHAEIADSGEVSSSHRGLAEAAASIGDAQVRNCGTLGGSLAHADPAADYPAAALAYDAEIVARGPDGERTLPASDFFAGLMATHLEPGEIVTEIRFPDSGGAAGAYEKFEQPASGFAIVGVCAVATVEDGAIQEARLGVTGVSDRPVRLRGLEDELPGTVLDGGALEAACEAADADLDDVREDPYAGGDYRRHLLRVHARRALLRCAG